LPEQVNLILVGDPYQLPPIGAGLTFHVLADAEDFPVARLTKVYRQSGESGIPTISNAIRQGEWPSIPEYNGKNVGVFCLQVGSDDIANRLVEIYEELGGAEENEQVQILSAVKADNAYGVVGINKAFHTRYTEGENLVLISSSTGELKDSGFRQNDKIIVIKNQWERRLFNGALGYIAEAFKTPMPLDEGRFLVAKAIIEGREICLQQDDLDWIMHSYSISIHKAQGSQFRRVIIPLSKSKLLDRTLIYTAVTRGIDQVVLLGDLAAAKLAVEALPHAWLRQIGFRTVIRSNSTLE
jgi:exodeoxyribonuclease V alpha subunit